MNEYIEDLLFDNDGELSVEMENTFVFNSKVKKCKQELKSFLDMKVDSETLHTVPSPNTENVKTEVELPILVLKRLSGGPLE